MTFNLELPINATSFGNISVSILREFYKRAYNPCIFPIGNIDLSNQPVTDDFKLWLQNCINGAPKAYKRSNPSFKLWHLNGSHTRVSDKNVLLTFYETDNPTDTELNIIANNDKVLFTSDYTTDIFKDYGANNVSTIPLAFDNYNFHRKEKRYFEDRIVFNIVGKWEHRKRHEKLIRVIAKHWKNNPKYHFQFAIYNPFFKPEDNQRLVTNALDGQRIFNMQFLGYMPDNSTYNDYLNSAHVVIGMSGGENWGLPEFHSVALGKHAVIHDAAGYRMWANKDNSVLVNPASKIPAFDGVFFHQNSPFNRGNFFDWSEDEFVSSVEQVIKRVESEPINQSGLKLQDQFSWVKTVDKILNHLTT